MFEPVEAKPPKLHPPNSSGKSVTARIKVLPRQQETKTEPERPLKKVSVRGFFTVKCH